MSKLSLDKVIKLVETGEQVAKIDAITAKSFALYPLALIYITFPHSRPITDSQEEISIWEKVSGGHKLTIKSGFTEKNKKTVFYGIPYGTLARILMAFITTEVNRTKSRKIYLGHSFSDFARKLNMQITGGDFGTIKRLKEQMSRLFEASIHYEYINSEGYSQDFGTRLTKEKCVWWDNKYTNIETKTLLEAYIVLDQDFYNQLMQYRIPLDMRVINQLKNSTLALDLYMFLSYKIPKLKKPLTIKWVDLHTQFGSSYNEVKKFTEACKKHLRKIHCIFPQEYGYAQIEYKRGAVTLFPSLPLLKKESKKKISS
jgi:hypothetical protein